MNFNQFFVSFILLIFACYGNTAAADSPCQDWLQYKDEKCFKVIDDTLRTFEEAEKTCAKLDNEPTLPIIQTKEEQDLLSNYLFKTLKKVDNFWIGARFVNNSFKWIDSSNLIYSNWDSKGSKNKENYCVQIQADDVLQGKWIDESCEKRNLVVCQKMQTWSMARLQKEFLNERKKLTDALDEANRQILVLKQNPIPIGFIYVQLPHQPDPKTLWSTVQWKDVTFEYKGLFFRAEGGDSAEFGTEQGENAPRVTQVRVTGPIPDSEGAWKWNNATFIVGGWSSGIGVLTGSFDLQKGYTHQFYQSGGEVRPRNAAIRVWKRFQ